MVVAADRADVGVALAPRLLFIIIHLYTIALGGEGPVCQGQAIRRFAGFQRGVGFRP
jgi:hypothetical protein